MLDRCGHYAVDDVAYWRPLNGIRLLSSLLFLTILTFALGIGAPARAEVRIVTAQGIYRMGDRDTKEDAIRLATESAKRSALEQVATFLESITIVEGVEITKDEIKTYTAGFVFVLDQQTRLTLDGDVAVVTVDLTAQLDTEEVAHAISVLRENEDARRQLAALKEEIDILHQELDSASQALALATTSEQLQEAGQQRQDILNQIQSNAIVAQAWTDWVIVAPVVYPYPWVGISRATAQLHMARELYPNSPHVEAAHYEMVAKQPPLPLQPPTSIAQSSPTQPGVVAMPSTLNDFSRTIPPPNPVSGMSTAARDLVTAPTGSSSWNELRQLNPVSPSPNSTPSAGQELLMPGPRSTRTFRRHMQPPTATPPTALPPVVRQPSPAFNRISPPMTQQQAPPTPSRSAPPVRGSGNHRGGGYHGGGRGR